MSMKTTLNFGALKDSVLKKASAELVNESKNSTMVTFMDAVRKNPVLKKQYLVYKNFEKTKPFTSERLAERFIQQNIGMMKGESWQNVQNVNAKLRQGILGGPDEWTVMAKKENAELYEHVSTLIEATINPMFKDWDKDAGSYSYLVEHLTRKEENKAMNEEKERPSPNRFWEFITKNALGYFNERYEAMDENERELFKVLISESKDKKERVSNMRDELIGLIESKMKDADNSRDDVVILESFRDKLKKKVDDEKLIDDEYIMSCSELKGMLTR